MKDEKIKNAINEIKKISMTDIEKSRIYGNILRSTNKTKPVHSPWSFMFMYSSHKLVYYIVIPLIIILSGGGVVFASQDSLPDGILYPIKVNIVEPAEGILTFSQKAKAEHESKLAKKRMVEAETLAKSGKLNVSNEKKINNLLSSHTASLNKALNKVSDSDSTEVKEDIITNFRAEMNAHAKVLEKLTKKEKIDKGTELDNSEDDEELRVSNTARVSAEKIKNTSGKVKVNKDNLKKYKEKKEKVKSLIDDTDKNINFDAPNKEKYNSVIVDTHTTIDQAKTYLDEADKKDEEGDWEEAYSSLLDSESSIKEANILIKSELKDKHGEENSYRGEDNQKEED